MNEFEFGRKVKICGTVYTIDVGRPGVAEQMKSFREQINDKLSYEKIKEISKQSIDLILGDGAFDDIFKGRTPTAPDVANLMRFIQNEVDEERKALKEQMTG